MDVIAREFRNTPPVTKCYTTICVLITVAVQLGLLTPLQLYFNPTLIFRSFQIWRLVTCFCFFGTFNINFFFNVLFLYRYCRMLEENWYRSKTADFVVMFLFGATLSVLIALFVHMIFLGHVLMMMLVYVWSRRNPLIRLNIFGILDINAPYLPWVFIAFSFLLGNSLVIDIVGMVIGHLYYFLEDAFPHQRNGFRILRTPNILKAIFDGRQAQREYDPLPEVERPGGFAWGEEN